MSRHKKVLIDLHDQALKNGLIEQIDSDWTTDLHATCDTAELENVDLAVVSRASLLNRLPKGTLTIFAGQPPEGAAPPFVVASPNLKALREQVHHALQYHRIMNVNQAASGSAVEQSHTSEGPLLTLSRQLQQLKRQGEMRISLVEQLPVAVIGIDDNDLVVLANARAREMMLNRSATIYATPYHQVLPDEICRFLQDPDRESAEVEWDELTFIANKDNFVLDSEYAGTVLTLTTNVQDIRGE